MPEWYRQWFKSTTFYHINGIGSSEAGLFSVESEFVFPGQEGCKPDQLMLRTTSVIQPDEEGTTPGSAKKVEIIHIWNGKSWVAQAPVETQLPMPVRETSSTGDSEGD
jgi:hypothetical protein